MTSIVRFKVDESMVAAFEGKVVHDVLSTFDLVYFSELAARRLIEPYLEESEDAAGYEISLKHLSPTKRGENVEIIATLKELDGKRLTCVIDGTNESGIICTGTHTQVLIRKGDLG